MGDYVSLCVDGSTVETDDMLTLSEGFRVQVEGDYDGSDDYTCDECNVPVDEYGMDEFSETECSENSTGYEHDDDGHPDCGPDCQLDGTDEHGLPAVGSPDHYTRETFGPHRPVRRPLAWVNSAAIEADPGADSVTVLISVGDPRGAFAFTVRQVTPDEGEPYLAMYTPYPGESLPHMPLTELHPGAYRVMNYGWTAPVEPEPVPELPWRTGFAGVAGHLARRLRAAWAAFRTA